MEMVNQAWIAILALVVSSVTLRICGLPAEAHDVALMSEGAAGVNFIYMRALVRKGL